MAATTDRSGKPIPMGRAPIIKRMSSVVSRGHSQSSEDGSEIDRSSTYEPLPLAFRGAKGLAMPSYLPFKTSGVTLPSRLDTLGNREFKLLAALRPFDVGNAVVVRPRFALRQRGRGGNH